MPLSEREQQLLAQLEQQLNAEDPKFASSMSSADAPPAVTYSARHVVLGVLIALVGLGVVIAGVSTKLILLGVFGCIITGVGVYVATLKNSSGVGKSSPKVRSSGKNTSRFMKDLEEKWDKRQNGGL
ncbi:DUF3040 domain-containing protein [Rothia sp. P6271]|uniref:DUF3040 domain-containing protein n=1 Tax=unclassified Rothia (in: high G+C Gram-positive bacteria) TaxID=2689056 RepID=UPI003AC3AE11